MCHHFHLSLQSGSTDTLIRMNRRYTAEEFEEVTKRLRKAYSDVILTTDIIVGFPGETDEEFEETFNFLKKIKFFKMHVFKYSIRNGTKAATMPNQVPGDIKELRSKRLLALSDENELEYIKNYIGKEVKVLFEEKDGEYYKGHTANYIMLKVKSPIDITEQMLTVKIKNVQGLELEGDVN
ncbi:MAG: radical SAM protein [Clostridia bacterium]|nr:radical SAM protein [Clostridia bacterium]